MINKKGQIAIWIILGVAIVVVVLLLFVSLRSPESSETKVFSVQESIESCVKKTVNDVADKMMLQGGFVNPLNGRMYNGTAVAYLCSSRTLYKPCVNQHPMLLEEMKNEIINYSKSKIDSCFDSVRQQVEKGNGKIELGNMDLGINFMPGKIELVIDRNVKIVQNGQTTNFDKFNVEVQNPLYDLANVAMIISNEEAKRCYFEYQGYNLLHPEFIVTKFTQSDSTSIYSIKDQQSGKIMHIAIRGCVIGAGFG
ncbi:MAG: hypothetical protein A2360_00630 [Candidatus Staskawiczbacteria bacterium RIFOXYB1_FULL_32_11]|nr:hypothetical protein [uncultured archaeon]OGZ78107.1 MAG: hypothetical protein A2360_00630 [Candidatus Staskawiczbacteria bacterium RIFOXYB1_FULL_32_11]